MFFWPSCLFEAWGTKAKKPHIFQKIPVFWPCRLRRQGPKTIFCWNKCVFLAWAPQASKKPLGQKIHRDPFEVIHAQLVDLPTSTFDDDAEAASKMTHKAHHLRPWRELAADLRAHEAPDTAHPRPCLDRPKVVEFLLMLRHWSSHDQPGACCPFHVGVNQARLACHYLAAQPCEVMQSVFADVERRASSFRMSL